MEILLPFEQKMPFWKLCNVNCAHNAIHAICPMPIVHKMPSVLFTQCQLYIQCQLCRHRQLCNPHDAILADNAIFAHTFSYVICTMPIV